MYKSLETTPVEDWEIIPSISVEVGEYLKEAYPSDQPVIMVDSVATNKVLERLMSRDAKPSIVEINIQKDIISFEQAGERPSTAQAVADPKPWGTRILFGITYQDSSELLTPAEMQGVVCYELQHAADFSSKKIATSNTKYENGEDSRSDSPYVRRARQAEKISNCLPAVIEISPDQN